MLKLAAGFAMAAVVLAPALALDVAGPGGEAFLKSAKLSCVATVKSDQLTRQLLGGDEQIDRYCECAINELSKLLVIDELKYAALNGTMPASANEKLTMVAPGCLRRALQKPDREQTDTPASR